MKIRSIATIICTLAMSTTGISVLASGPQEGPQKREQSATWERETMIVRPDAGGMFHGNLQSDQFLFVSSEMSFDGKLVKDAPYSAVAVTESIQTLADGNRLVRKTSASVYRDSAGRTRREQSLARIGPYSSAADTPNTILINDPVAEVNYILEPNSRIARKMSLPRKMFDVRVGTGETMRHREGTVVVGPSSAEGHEKMAHEKMARIASGMGGEVFAAGKAGNKESLGKQMIDGVEAEGTRITVTIPAGQIGNERPIEMISERWYSPELQVVIRSRHSDPRSGETTYTLTNISRAEPAASLFEVPADYSIKEGGAADVRVQLEQKLRQQKKDDKEQQ